MNIENDSIEKYFNWCKEKFILKFSEKKISFPIYYNCIYWAYLGENIGSEQDKHRPILITRTFKNSTLVNILPLTSKRLNDNKKYHIDLEELDSTVLCEQLRVIDIKRLDKPMMKNGKIQQITKNDWEFINEQLKRQYLLCPIH